MRRVPGRGHSGFRLSFRERPLDAGDLLEVPAGFRTPFDAYSRRRPPGSALDYDLEKEKEGFWLDHPDAAFAASC